MKKMLLTISTAAIVIAQAAACYAGRLSSDVEQYVSEVQPLLMSTTNALVQAFLTNCLSDAARLKGLEAYDSRTSAAFDGLVANRLKYSGILTKTDRSDPAVHDEKNSYDKHLYPYREEQYVALVRLQDQLFERKYFESETSKNANFLEGVLNSRWSLTRADDSDPLKVLNEPTLGVSPWEAILRFEPALAFDGGAQPALLGTFGLTRTFFPSVTRTSNGVSFDESIWSKYVHKTGLRLGVGVEKSGDQTDFVAGLSAQVWSVGLWGLYRPDNSEFMLGVSMSDLSKLKKILGWFD